MSFQNFLNSIIVAFGYVFSSIQNTITNLLNNNFIKFIIYLILLEFIIFLFGGLLSFIFNIFSMKKESGKNKTNSNTDIE